MLYCNVILESEHYRRGFEAFLDWVVLRSFTKVTQFFLLNLAGEHPLLSKAACIPTITLPTLL